MMWLMYHVSSSVMSRWVYRVLALLLLFRYRELKGRNLIYVFAMLVSTFSGRVKMPHLSSY